MFAFINKTRLDTITSGSLLWDGFHCLFFHSYHAESDLIIKIVVFLWKHRLLCLTRIRHLQRPWRPFCLPRMNLKNLFIIEVLFFPVPRDCFSLKNKLYSRGVLQKEKNELLLKGLPLGKRIKRVNFYLKFEPFLKLSHKCSAFYLQLDFYQKRWLFIRTINFYKNKNDTLSFETCT